MSSPRKTLFERLPEIYHIYDQQQARAAADEEEIKGPLEAYLDVIDQVFGSVRDNIEDLYHDFFIETCADWVVPYIADLLGTSHLSGDPWTIRADVARTIKHRRRKGTLGAIESVTYTLTEWAVHTVELRELMCWNQHINHQRPDAGGKPPLQFRNNIIDAVRGGTVTLRDPSVLSAMGQPFDAFAHVADLKPPMTGAIAYNIPNLAIFLWRLEDYQLRVIQPSFSSIEPMTAASGAPAFAVRFHIDPLAEPMVLFNTHRYEADDEPPNLTHVDAVPGPMPAARLKQEDVDLDSHPYIRVVPYSALPVPAEVGLTLHVPETAFPSTTQWTVRGANLCAWEAGARPALSVNEIAIDPQRGRIVFCVATEAPEAEALRDQLLISPTYGFPGPTGAHPITRDASPEEWQEATPVIVRVSYHDDADALSDALTDLSSQTAPLIIEIDDSMTHDLDAGELLLARSLWIRAVSGQRPIIRLAQPLRFRPVDVTGSGAAETIAGLNVKLEGLFITAASSLSSSAALIEQAAVNQLTLDGCTLHPGGNLVLDGTASGSRADVRAGMRLTNSYGFSDPAEEEAFEPIPVIELYRTITGPLEIDSDYALQVTGSIVDAASGEYPHALAVGAATGDPESEWGPALTVDGLTSFGRMRVEEATGQGGIWMRRLEVHDNQKGCIRFSYVSGDHDRLPPNQGLVSGPQAMPVFTSEIFGRPGYAQLSFRTDTRILEHGPENDEMGAFGYLKNSHRWKNINIRYREFMPVGIRPILLPVT